MTPLRKMARLWNVYLKLLLIGVLVLGLMFRMGNLSTKPYWEDEVSTSIRVSGYLLGVVKADIPNQVVPVESLFHYRDIRSGRSWIDTVDALINHPEHTPLYFMLARLWAQIFGSSVGAMRALPALISLLTLPLFYWISRLLFESRETAAVTLCLACVCPILIRQAQEARPYSLWMMGVLASSALLLSALRSNRRSTWKLYSLTVTLTFLTHLLSTLVFVMHGIYVFSLYRDPKTGSNQSTLTRADVAGSNTAGSNIERSNIERLNPTRLNAAEMASVEPAINRTRMQNFQRFFGIGMIPVLPWLILVIAQFGFVQSVTEWQNQTESFQELMILWTTNVSYLLFFWMPPERWLFFAVLLFLLIAFCVYRLLLQSRLRQWLLPVLFCVIPSLLFMGYDVLFGGIRSTISRYFIPTYLGSIFILGFGLGFGGFRLGESLQSRGYKWIRRILFHTVLVAMIVASWQNLQSPLWWKDYQISLLGTAQMVMRSPTPATIVSDDYLARVMSVAFLLRPTDRILWFASADVESGEAAIDKIFDSSERVFLYGPSENLLDQIDASLEERQLTIEPTGVEYLFQLKKAI